MKIQKILTMVSAFLFLSIGSFAQNAKYIGEWKMIQSPIKDKCGQDQIIVLRKNGTATYHFGKDTKGCKKSSQEFETWKVTTRSFKQSSEIIKKTVLIIGEFEDIVFVIDNIKGKTMQVSTEIVDEDTTQKASLVFKKIRK